MSTHKRLFGLLGRNIGYSFSPNYFKKKFEVESIDDAEYRIFDLENIDLFDGLRQKKTLAGLNVTIPYKQSIIPFLDALELDAKDIGAVNTIKFQHNQLIGYNTDIIGAERSLQKLIGRRKVEHALILGTGGASLAIQFVLNKKKIPFKTVSRKNGNILYHNLTKSDIKDSRLIINTTPLGTFPYVDKFPLIPYEALNKKHLLFDLVYNPENTLFLNFGKSKSCRTMNGLYMLEQQAEASWKIWNNNHFLTE